MTPELPAGTVTFLFTDIEGSTRLLKQLGAESYAALLADQRVIMRATFDRWAGQEVDTQGDSFYASLQSATQAGTAAAEIQQKIARKTWPKGVRLRVRMGLHTGEPLVSDSGYEGIDVHRAARIAHIGHGGQILLSSTTAELLKFNPPEGIQIQALGTYKLKDLEAPKEIFQLIIAGLPSDFPGLKAKLVKPAMVITGSPARPQPGFLTSERPENPPSVTGAPFVARERELSQLNSLLDQTLAGQSKFAFISGGPGRGKTALLEAFNQQAMQNQSKLLVVSGRCHAYAGMGDPYLPFRQVLAMLCGDVEAQWSSGVLNTEHARRLWKAVPVTAAAIAEHGQDLIGHFISGKKLLNLADQASNGKGAPLIDLENIAKRDKNEDPGQKGLFEGFTKVVRAVAAAQPLLITLDDLHWADRGTLDLLTHLVHELGDARVLILGTLRSEEVSLGKSGERHPLEKVLTEYKRQYGEELIALGEETSDEAQVFVNAFLNSEPNSLSNDFRESLFKHTKGHPLFTIELLRTLQANGNLVQDEAGRWVEGPNLNWTVIPSKVEGVIEERFGRLPEDLRDLLQIASVEGDEFTAQVIAQVQGGHLRGVVRLLSQDLEKKHRLISEAGHPQVGHETIFKFRFRHGLFRNHLYQNLSQAERQIIHGEVGTALEKIYKDQSGEIVPQLAWHFSEAGLGEKASHYLILAADNARKQYANQEAIELYQKAVDFLKDLGDEEAVSIALLKLGAAYHNAFDFQNARQAFQESFAFRQPNHVVQSGDPSYTTQTLRIVTSEPPSLEPSLTNDSASALYLNQLFTGLIKIGQEGEILPDLAQSWAISADGQKYIFNLREDIQWSDGRPVWAADFEYAWKRALTHRDLALRMFYDIKGARQFHRGKLAEDEVGVKTLDDRTLEVELEKPASYFLHMLSHNFFVPVPRHVVEEHGTRWTEAEHIVTNGPFLVEAHEPGEFMVLERYADFHGDYRGNLQRVEILFQKQTESAGQLEAYKAGALDMLRVWDPYRQFGSEYIQILGGPVSLGFNSRRSPFRDSRIRQAFAAAINRDLLIEEVYDSEIPAVTGGFIPPGIPGHSPELRIDFDPDLARGLLEEAGFSDGKRFPAVKALYAEVALHLAEFLHRQWREVLGIDIKFEIKPWSHFLDLMDESDLFIQGWSADYPDPDTFLRVGLRRIAPGWRDEAYDQLMEKAGQTHDQKERIQLYKAADKILIEEAALVPLIQNFLHWLAKPWVHVSYSGTSWQFKDFVVEPH